MRTVIFANGVLTPSSFVNQAIQSADVWIAADGGALHCRRLGITPHIVIGDFDSLEPVHLSELKTAGAELIQHPARKDFTDLELALQHAVNSGSSQIMVLAALGNRWDQTLANLLLPAARDYLGVKISLVDGQQEIHLIRPGETRFISGNTGDTVSLIPLWGDAQGISTQGLEYPLQGETLFFGSTRGISNALTGEKASVHLEHGLLVSVIIHTDQGDEGDVHL